MEINVRMRLSSIHGCVSASELSKHNVLVPVPRQCTSTGMSADSADFIHCEFCNSNIKGLPIRIHLPQ